MGSTSERAASSKSCTMSDSGIAIGPNTYINHEMLVQGRGA
jgi:hypothetical protein